MIIRRIAPAREQRKLRVAAYCRVSTTTEEQTESYETQMDYYTRLIKQNSNWEYVDIYADRKSATSAEHRPEFQRMMADGRDKKFDILLVKAISRFARNVVDAQKYVHELKGYDVEVRFENESISSADPTAEMMFNILAVTAQEESRIKSEYVRWSYRKHGAKCHNPNMTEEDLLHAISDDLGWAWTGVDGFDAWAFEQLVSKVEVGTDGIKVFRQAA